MFSSRRKDVNKELADKRAFMDLIDRTQAVIEFQTDGTILRANENFLSALGYELSEVVGQHHSMFVHPDQVASEAYRDHWRDLASGKFFTDQFARFTKSGEEIWIQATYAPILDSNGDVEKVVKIATDVTERRRRTNEIASGLADLAQGDLSKRVALSDLEDLNAVGRSFNDAMGKLSSAINAVMTVSLTVSSVADRINGSVSELSQRTENQAATLEETAAALDEVTSTAKSAAEGAQKVGRIVADAISRANESNEVVQNAVEAMDQVQDSSNKISHIISVIEDISFQTSLLALNAGVEAARAGEAGRGFAVVASEVRALAKRSTEAASEIKVSITESSQHVDDGVALVRKAGNELSSIIENVGKISGHVTEIVHGAHEQSTALDEINVGVRQLDSVTQQNAAMVDETSNSSQILVKDATNLSSQVSIFRLAPNNVMPMRTDLPERDDGLGVVSSF